MQPNVANDGLSVDDVRKELSAGRRVLLLVRHSERPKIAGEDKSFGAALPLTANGERMSVDFGRLLRGASDSVQFRASPLHRTVMTAERIAEGMGLAGAEVVRDGAIGNDSAFVVSQLEMWRLFNECSFFGSMIDYMRRGEQRGFAPLVPAAEAYERHALSTFTAKLGIYTTHDVFIVAFLHAMGVKTDFTTENWPRFLDSAAIIVEPSGKIRHAFVRAGLSTLFCGV